MEDSGLGGRFWLITLGIVVGAVFGAVMIFLLVAGAWARWGLIGALIFFGLVLAGFSYTYDRAHAKKWEED